MSSDFEALLEYLRVARGFDFGAYKRTTLKRRIEKRMAAVGAESFSSYLDYLQVHSDEFQLLFNTILINVTAFFRDPEAWTFLRDHVILEIVERIEPQEHIRVWSAGCASGEEAYSLAALFADALGPEAFKSRVKLYATDLDDDALQRSRQATYTKANLHDVDPGILDRHFELSNDRYVFDRELRRAIIFGRHDLIADAPISRIDLLVCRNTLMYFNSEVQEKILSRFHFALNPGGFLFLGQAEAMLTHGNIFTPVDMRHRIFVKSGAGNSRDRLMGFANRATDGSGQSHVQIQIRMRDLALDASPVAQIIVGMNGSVALINERARTKFGLTLRDLGRPVQDLEISYRPIELRSLIEQVQVQRRPLTMKEVAWQQATGEPGYLNIQITPLAGDIGTSISFADVTDMKRLQEELVHSNQELETAYEELQSTNEELQTTNEELQSTIEELETTNEELHSTNEELETMNEELQSTNEELESINLELRRASEDLNRSNAFLSSVLSSLRSAVVVVDAQLRILAWNERAHDMWGLRSDEVKGQHLLNLDIGFPVDGLRKPIKAVLADALSPAEFETEAINRRGKSLHCRATCSALTGADGRPLGVIVSIEET